ncbi:MAG TPA: hypothetical protein VG992_01350, partial [Candidatus Saccharimonadales bacterium]|nr:hypothetical protein [Candidatus Saccharimonadales bacterium]
LRQRLIAGQLGDQRLVTLLIKLLEVPIAHDPNRYLEIVILEATLPAARTVISTEGEKSQAAISTEERSLGKPRDDKLEEVEPPVTEEVVAEVVIADDAPRPAKPKKASSHKLEGDAWTNILNALKGNYNTLYGVVRIAEPRFEDDGSLTLAVAFPFHQKRLNEARNQQVLSTVIEEVMGRPVMVTCIVDKAAKAPTTAAASAVTSLDPALTTISNIFGGGELLE